MTDRATQRRAQFVTNFGAELRVVWVITNASRPLIDLVEDAEHDLPDVLFEQRLAPAGPYRWHQVEGPDGSRWLVADVRVQAWSDPRRDGTRRATTPPD